MPDIRCPNCGKNNPDSLDVCQFCQTPLQPESMLHIGEKPTKKNTGELEPVLPEWLKDVRQQARDAADEDEAQAATKPNIQKVEPPDLLAGLASQSESADEEEVPDWLSGLASPTGKEKSVPSTPATPEKNFFAQFNKNEPSQEEETPSQMSGQSQVPPERDELSEWFTQAAEQPVEHLSIESDQSQINEGWELPAESTSVPETPIPKEDEDLSWLHNLEEESKKTGELATPKQESDWFSEFNAPVQSSGQDDLSWLNNLGALPASNQPAQPPAESNEDLSWLNNLGALPATDQPAQPPAESKEDLSWLNNLGGLQTSDKPAKQPSEAQDDLSWLNNIDATPAPEQPLQQPPQPQEDLSWLNAFNESLQPSQPETTPSESQDELDWRNQLGDASPLVHPTEQNLFASEQSTTQDDLSWLNELQGSSESLSAAPFVDQSLEQEESKGTEEPAEASTSPFTPRRTAQLNPEEDAPIPDWLKSATEGPSMPLGAGELDQFREDYNIPSGPEQPFSWKSFMAEPKPDEETTFSESKSVFGDSSLEDSSTLSNQDVDSLFSTSMPDWLSSPAPEDVEKPAQEVGIDAEGGDALTPVDLPSWVQAMRPVEAVIFSETPVVEDQPEEHEGPLAGFKGVIPIALIGSLRKPQAIPLKLQASDEQQASAAIVEQILASETSPRALLSAPTYMSQRVLRQAIAVLVWVVLGTFIFMGTQIMPVSPVLPPDVAAASRTVELIPDNSPVLVVMDYEPSLAGELEAAGGPLLNHLVLLRHPRLSFISTSPTGSGLVEHLLTTTGINKPEGPGYVAGRNYFNLGYLPGGEAGVLAFIQSPQVINSSAAMGSLSQYAAIIILTDHADSARSWVEQLQTLKQADPTLASQPLLVVSSAQAGPMLQPYVGSGQINGLVNGLADAARYENKNNVPPGIARTYWDAFGMGIILAVVLIVLGSVWILLSGMRSNRAEIGEG